MKHASSKTELFSDEQLVQAVCAGNTELFRLLVKRYESYVFGLIVRQIGDPDLSQDCAQEVFVRVYKNLHRFKHQSLFSTWLTRIALNHSKSVLRARSRQRTKEQSAEVLPWGTESPESKILSSERVKKFQSALVKLPDTQREAIVLCGLQGMSYEEAALVMKIPVGTVRSRLHKARNMLKKMMREGGI